MEIYLENPPRFWEKLDIKNHNLLRLENGDNLLKLNSLKLDGFTN
jgi:hypothetical protein